MASSSPGSAGAGKLRRHELRQGERTVLRSVHADQVAHLPTLLAARRTGSAMSWV